MASDGKILELSDALPSELRRSNMASDEKVQELSDLLHAMSDDDVDAIIKRLKALTAEQRERKRNARLRREAEQRGEPSSFAGAMYDHMGKAD